MANNRICLTCGKEYEYCSNCSGSSTLPIWMNLYESENCKNIFHAVSDYAQSVITKETASKKLKKCDLSELETFKPNIKKYIKEINATASIVKEEDSELVEEKIIEKETVKEDVVKKTIYSKKKR